MPEVKGFIETSFVDWPGRVCAVIFLSGCNFRCPYCHNHPLVTHPETLATLDFKEILGYLVHRQRWLGGVCVSGGEPTLSPALPGFLESLKNRGFSVKLDTNGTRPEILQVLIDDGLVDMVAMDVKAPLLQEKYEQCAGVQVDLDQIRRSIALLRNSGIRHQFRMTVLPRFHSEEDLVQLREEIGNFSELKIQNFNPATTLDPAYNNEPPFSPENFALLQGVISRKNSAIQRLTKQSPYSN